MSVRSIWFLSFIVPLLVWEVPLVSLILLELSLLFRSLLFCSVSLHWSLRKAFWSLLPILWISASNGNIFPFLLFLLLLSFFKLFSYIYISWRLISLQYCSGFCHTLTWIRHGCICVPHPDPPSHPFPIPSLWVILVHQLRALVSCIKPGLVICFTLDNIHVSMLFSQIIPPSPSPTESISLFYTSRSLLVSCI